ncbi:MAG: Gfo/Idh/MocA family oxidoreductase [Oscillospiraceae bacterium]|jgi:predicted dehydrogenase|nr:Gfo/Idh/MocA family oxidoreductase [Oscillospiraceae bacterium]
MIPFAVVGTSWITEEFIKAAKGTPLRLVAICSRSQERGLAFARKIGQTHTRVYTSVEALANDASVQACYVASPNSCHYAQSKLLLTAGKHVICEKPITATPAQLTELQTRAKAKRLIYMEAIMYLHTPMRQALREAIRRAGRISAVRFDFSQRSSKLDALLAGEVPNIFNPALAAGAWNDLGIYCMYPCLDFFGEPLSCVSQANMLSTGADGAGAALLRYDDAIAALTWSKLGQSRGVSQIIGEKGTITITSISQLQQVYFYDNGGNRTRLDTPMQKHEVMRFEVGAFCDFVFAGAQNEAYAESSRLARCVSGWMETVRGYHPQPIT